MKSEISEIDVKITDYILKVLRFYKEENLNNENNIGYIMNWSTIFGYEVRKRLEYFKSTKGDCSDDIIEITIITLDLFSKFTSFPKSFKTKNDYCRFVSTVNPDFWQMFGLEYEDFVNDNLKEDK